MKKAIGDRVLWIGNDTKVKEVWRIFVAEDERVDASRCELQIWFCAGFLAYYFFKWFLYGMVVSGCNGVIFSVYYQ